MSSQSEKPGSGSSQSATTTDEEIDEAVLQEQVIFITSHEKDLIVVEQGTPAKRKCMRNVQKQITAMPYAKPITSSYKFPNRFRPDLQDLSKYPTSVIILKHQSAILREVTNSLQNYTYKPTAFEFNNVVTQLLNRYPHLTKLKSPEHQHVSTRTSIINYGIIFI
jgi:hypothetical protein